MSSRLDWPSSFERTSSEDREPYPHGFRVSRRQAFDNILDELRKMDARDVRLDTGARHQTRNPNKPYKDSSFEDPGVVVYFKKHGEKHAVPCDRWDNPRDNAQAIAKYLNAKRAINRYGVQTIESEFSTARLPPGDKQKTTKDPHEILEVSEDAGKEVIEAAARQKKKKHHPDKGGDKKTFSKIVKAEKQLLKNKKEAKR